jgi:hypothetical protein
VSLDLGKILCPVGVKEHDLVVLLALLVRQIESLQIMFQLRQCDLIPKVNVDFYFHTSATANAHPAANMMMHRMISPMVRSPS